MRLEYLRLRNFRQHADTEITFQPGLTGIIGPNGAGKSTILEAIAWSVYGSAAARGTNETLRFVGAPARSRVEVELAFQLGGHAYRVLRTLNNAEVFLDGGNAPVAATLGGATSYLQGRLGMSREEFFNTYFTGQKELQFLAAMGAAERGRFMSQVLGYERLRRAQDLARVRRSELRQEVRALEAALPDPEKVAAARREADERVANALRALAAAEAERSAAATALAEIAPRWENVQASRERFRELSHRVQTLQGEQAAAEREAVRVAGELERVAAAEAELAPLRLQLAPLPALADEVEQLEGRARSEERRVVLARQLAELDVEIQRDRERLARVDQAPELLRRFAGELAAARSEHARVKAELEATRAAWLRDQQDAETSLRQFRDHFKELEARIERTRRRGPDEPCPTCGRALGADFTRVLEELEDERARIEQDGVWLKHRQDQLRTKPPELAELEGRVAELDRRIEMLAQKHTRCEGALEERKRLQGEQGAQTRRRTALAAELAALPAGYDAERHGAARTELAMLRRLETRAATLQAAVARQPALLAEQQQARARAAAVAAQITDAAAERDALGFSEAGFAALQQEHAAARDRVHRAEIAATRLQGELATAEEGRKNAEQDEQDLRDRLAVIALQQADFRHHDELDDALSELRQDLNTQVRPELAEVASSFLAQLTDGRYTAMEIDEQYNILVLDEGEPKPVISGGEEDVANLVLRLAMSQMIAERAGHPLSLLILDEVFGSLDVARRDNVVQLLHHLGDRFEQVILITHIEPIRESLDQVLRVEWDERTGASRVTDESPPVGGDSPWEPEMAAD